MGGEAQSAFRGIGIDLAEKLRRSLLLVAADSDSDHMTVAVACSQLEHRPRGLGSKLPDRIKNPQQGDAEIPLTAVAAALQSLKQGGKVLLAVQADAHRHIDLGVQHILRLELLHQLVGDEFVVLGRLQVFRHRLERLQEAGEVAIAVKLFHLRERALLAVTFPQFEQSGGIDGAFEVEVKICLGKGSDKRTGA